MVRATPGQPATFGPIEVRGNASVGEDVILRQLAFKPGDRYSAGRVRASQSRLSSLDLFRFAYVEPRGHGGRCSRPAVPMRITVAEDKHRQFTGAVGYGTEEKARIRGEWKHVNFFGGARSAGIESKFSSLDRGVRLNFNEPWFFTRHLVVLGAGADLGRARAGLSRDHLRRPGRRVVAARAAQPGDAARRDDVGRACRSSTSSPTTASRDGGAGRSRRCATR